MVGYRTSTAGEGIQGKTPSVGGIHVLIRLPLDGSAI
jgi:hypothetical protein